MSQRNPTTVEVDAYAAKYIETGDQSAAFRAAFPNSKARPETINQQASIFNKLPNVCKRVEELRAISREVAVEEFTVTIEQKKKILAQVAKQGLVDGKGLSAAVSAVSELNRMDGHHAATNSNINHGGEINAELEFKVSFVG